VDRQESHGERRREKGEGRREKGGAGSHSHNDVEGSLEALAPDLVKETHTGCSKETLDDSRARSISEDLLRSFAPRECAGTI